MSDDGLAAAAATDAEATAPASLDEAIGSPGALMHEIEAELAPEHDHGDGPALAALVDPISPMVLPELADEAVEPLTMRDMRLLAEIDVEVTVEFGRARLALRDLLSLRRGSLVELSRTLDQPVSVLANDTLVAYGEIVLVGDRFGVHVLEIVDPEERDKPTRTRRSSPVAIGDDDWVAEPVDPAGDDGSTDPADGSSPGTEAPSAAAEHSPDGGS